MKQLYKVPFERNSQRNKEFRRAYVDGLLEMDAHAIPHEFIFIDEAGFNLAKTRRRGRNVIGHRAIIDVPGQHHNAMEEACDEIDVGAIQGWIRHSRRFFPQCLADIACDVDEALWPDPAVRQDAA
ncbi:uncharacterized protein LOC122881522, partial [Tachysurus ichikawai]